jgi:hypothetical protein
VTVGAVLALTSIGVMYIGLKEHDQTAVVSWNVCDRDVVDRYNEFAVGRINIAELDDLVKEIEKRTHSSGDPTCVAIRLIHANFINNSDEIKKWRDTLIELNDDGLYPNNRMLGDIVIDTTGDQNIMPTGQSGDEKNL